MIEKRNGGWVVTCDTCEKTCDEVAFTRREEALEDALWSEWMNLPDGKFVCLRCSNLIEWEKRMKHYEIRNP
jgi:hypothetical protein